MALIPPTLPSLQLFDAKVCISPRVQRAAFLDFPRTYLPCVEAVKLLMSDQSCERLSLLRDHASWQPRGSLQREPGCRHLRRGGAGGGGDGDLCSGEFAPDFLFQKGHQEGPRPHVPSVGLHCQLHINNCTAKITSALAQYSALQTLKPAPTGTCLHQLGFRVWVC